MCHVGLSDAAAVPLEAVEEEAKGPNPFNMWIEFIRSSVLGINDFYKGERETSSSEFNDSRLSVYLSEALRLVLTIQFQATTYCSVPGNVNVVSEGIFLQELKSGLGKVEEGPLGSYEMIFQECIPFLEG